jgi:hypothetical protein
MMSLPATSKGISVELTTGLMSTVLRSLAVEVDIENAGRDLAVLEALDFLRQPLRERHAAPPDADEGEPIEGRWSSPEFSWARRTRVSVDLGRTHQLSFFAGGRP